MKCLIKSSLIKSSLIKSSLAILMLLAAPVSLLQANDADMKSLKEALAKRLPQATDAIIKKTPVKGLYEVTTGGQIIYVSKNARYIIDGDMFDMKTKRNLAEETRGGIRVDALNKLGEKNMLVYQPDGKVENTITVFTDIYCPYCQRLHEEMDVYKKNGVKVRYIFVPFKGKRSVDTSVSVWCAKDQNKAMDKAKSGQEIEQKTCDNPISKHRALAEKLGVRGTPAIMLESGHLMPGYVPAERLVKQLKMVSKK